MSLSLYGSYYLSRIGLLETTGQLPTLTRGKRRCAYRLPQRGIWQTGNYNDYATNTHFREGEEVSEDKQSKKGLGGLGSALGNVTEQVGEVAAGATEQVGEVAGGATEQVGEVAGGATEQVGQATQGVQDAAGQAVDQVSQTAGGLSPGLQEVTEQGQDTLGREATGQGGQVAQGVQDTAVQATQQAQDPAGRAAQQANTTEQPTQQTGGGQETAGQLSEPTSAASQKAEELGVDLTQVEGSGPGGRITLQDVMNATKQG